MYIKNSIGPNTNITIHKIQDYYNVHNVTLHGGHMAHCRLPVTALKLIIITQGMWERIEEVCSVVLAIYCECLNPNTN